MPDPQAASRLLVSVVSCAGRWSYALEINALSTERIWKESIDGAVRGIKRSSSSVVSWRSAYQRVAVPALATSSQRVLHSRRLEPAGRSPANGLPTALHAIRWQSVGICLEMRDDMPTIPAKAQLRGGEPSGIRTPNPLIRRTEPAIPLRRGLRAGPGRNRGGRRAVGPFTTLACLSCGPGGDSAPACSRLFSGLRCATCRPCDCFDRCG